MLELRYWQMDLNYFEINTSDTYYHSHFLAATLDFTSFFTIAFLRATHFFYSLAVLD